MTKHWFRSRIINGIILVRIYEEQKADTTELISCVDVSINTDLWTSVGSSLRSYFTVTAHFITNSWDYKSILWLSLDHLMWSILTNILLVLWNLSRWSSKSTWQDCVLGDKQCSQHENSWWSDVSHVTLLLLLPWPWVSSVRRTSS